MVHNAPRRVRAPAPRSCRARKGCLFVQLIVMAFLMAQAGALLLVAVDSVDFSSFSQCVRTVYASVTAVPPMFWIAAMLACVIIYSLYHCTTAVARWARSRRDDKGRRRKEDPSAAPDASKRSTGPCKRSTSPINTQNTTIQRPSKPRNYVSSTKSDATKVGWRGVAGDPWPALVLLRDGCYMACKTGRHSTSLTTRSRALPRPPTPLAGADHRCPGCF